MALNQVLNAIRMQFPRGMESGTFNDYLTAVADGMPGVRTLVVLDDKGFVLAANWPNLVGFDARNRDYFRTVKQTPDAEMLYISQPFLTRLGVYTLSVSRALTNVHGGFAGVVTATLDPGYFSPLLDSVRYRPDMTVALVHWEGDVFLSLPINSEAGQHRSFARDPSFTDHRRNGKAVSVLPKLNRPDSEERMMTQQTVRPPGIKLDKPLVVRIERSTKAIFQGWQREVRFVLAMYLLLFGGALFGIHAYQRGQIEVARREQEAARKVKTSEQLMKAVTDHLPALVSYWTAELECRFANGAHFEWFGKEPEQMKGIRMQDLLGEDLFGKNEPFVRAALQGRPQQFEYTLTKQDGSEGHTWAQYIPDRSNGRINGFFALVSDITPIKDIQIALAESEWKLKTIIHAEPECVTILGSDGMIQQMNPAGLSMIGAESEEQAIGLRLYTLIDPQYHADIDDLMAVAARGESGVLMFELTGLTGVHHWVECHAVPMRGKDGQITGCLCVIRDMTDRKKVELELQKLAQTDSLTGLNNRRHFLSLAEQEAQRSHRYGGPLTVMMIDIDHFKKVNDTYGHKSGDAVIRSFADLCRNSLRSVDIIGRLGGEEFAVMMPETDIEHASTAANLLKQRAAQILVAGEKGEAIRFTVSIGVASRTVMDHDLDALLSEADQALYEAKQTGRNKVCRYGTRPISA